VSLSLSLAPHARSLTVTARGGRTTAMQKLRSQPQKVRRGRQKMVLERWTNPKPQRRTRSLRCEASSCRGKSAGVAKRPRERSPTRNPYRHDSQLLHRCTYVVATACAERSTAASADFCSCSAWAHMPAAALDLLCDTPVAGLTLASSCSKRGERLQQHDCSP
jgi:hypothetical protein